MISPVFILTAFPCSGGYHLERGGMPLHDAVVIICKMGATTENQGAGACSSILAKMCMFYDCVCVI